MITVLYHVGISDFTCLVRPSVEGRREVDEDVERGRTKIWKRFGFRGEVSSSPKLPSNRTI
ncbi:hypothetical protein RHMOL_Rhmol04G0216400 [Rhododendron molle]|uniref:Uncharacterized protein n=2 Tax=Rhododendron molle TaxID=49168 RepID=A0ACC0P3B2_RHOML|nr:hypothetical protein RHMOL_Rhmol04G0216200 [Rhododendron molle]KAI8559950.1 hypothetical protein RHMOL_Rhmol04G0216400 [Rhododendron molle]